MDFFAAQARVGIRSHRIAPAPSETLPHPSLAATGSLASRVPHGDVAQLVERSVRNAEVRGSTPLVSTSPLPGRRSGPQGEGPEELQEALELVPSGRRSAPASVVHRLTAYSCFRAEHAIREADGAFEPVHAHDWSVSATIAGAELGPRGLLVDFRELRAALEEAVRPLQGALLNELPEFAERPPTAELVTELVYRAVRSRLPDGVRLEEVRLRRGPVAAPEVEYRFSEE